MATNKEMMKILKPVEISNTGWQYNEATSLKHRGISDYLITISFSRALKHDEREWLRRYLNTLEKPGWTEVAHQSVTTEDGVYSYTFHTCWDSSD